jgi:hypothetical protein
VFILLTREMYLNVTVRTFILRFIKHKPRYSSPKDREQRLCSELRSYQNVSIKPFTGGKFSSCVLVDQFFLLIYFSLTVFSRWIKNTMFIITLLNNRLSRSQSSSISIMIGLRVGRPWFNSGQEQGFSSLRHRVQTGPETHPASCQTGMGGGGRLSARVKRSGREAGHSLPSSAEVKNTWSCSPTFPYVPYCIKVGFLCF